MSGTRCARSKLSLQGTLPGFWQCVDSKREAIKLAFSHALRPESLSFAQKRPACVRRLWTYMPYGWCSRQSLHLDMIQPPSVSVEAVTLGSTCKSNAEILEHLDITYVCAHLLQRCTGSGPIHGTKHCFGCMVVVYISGKSESQRCQLEDHSLTEGSLFPPSF